MSADRARGQSEVVGELLLVGVVVLSLSVGGAYVLADLSEPDDEAYADLDASVENGTLAVVHRGGQALRGSDLRLRVAVNGTAAPGVTWANGTVEGDGDDRFELGERFTHPVPGASADARVAVTLAAVDADDADRTGAVLYEADDVAGRDGAAPVGSSPDGSTPTDDGSDEPTPTTPTESPPNADAGPDRTVAGEAGENVTLDGTGSSDPDGDAVSYGWRVADRDGLSTDATALVDADTATPEFRVTENVTDRTHAVVVELTVDDGNATDTDRMTVTVEERVEARIDTTPPGGEAPLTVEFVGLAEPGPNEGVVDFGERTVRRYDPGGQDGQGGSPTGASVEDGGRTLRLTNNSWRSVDFAYDTTADTVVRFDFRSPRQGEIHALGFETDQQQTAGRFLTAYGTQDYGRRLGYAGDGAFRTYEPRLGPGYPDGTPRYLVFVNDHDVGERADAVSEFRDVVVYEERSAYTFEWDFDGDGSYDETGQQPDHTFSSAGTYDVGLRVTAPDGRQRVLNRTVEVSDPTPPPTAAAAATPTDPRVGEEVTFDGSGSTDPVGDGLTYEWDVDGDGTYDATGATVTHTYGSYGTYDATLRVTDDRGRTATDTVAVVVGETTAAVNLGGDAATFDGVRYARDRGGSNGDTSGGTGASTNDPIVDTTADPLYQTERYGDFEYRPAVEDGTYRVRLEFAELYWGDGRVREGPDPTGDRVFDVLLEGDRQVDDLDVYARVGHDRALVLSYTVEVTDGRLDVAFRTEADNAKGSAVVVERVG